MGRQVPHDIVFDEYPNFLLLWYFPSFPTSVSAPSNKINLTPSWWAWWPQCWRWPSWGWEELGGYPLPPPQTPVTDMSTLMTSPYYDAAFSHVDLTTAGIMSTAIPTPYPVPNSSTLPPLIMCLIPNWLYCVGRNGQTSTSVGIGEGWGWVRTHIDRPLTPNLHQVCCLITQLHRLSYCYYYIHHPLCCRCNCLSIPGVPSIPDCSINYFPGTITYCWRAGPDSPQR